jgi:hypothetical protein
MKRLCLVFTPVALLMSAPAMAADPAMACSSLASPPLPPSSLGWARPQAPPLVRTEIASIAELTLGVPRRRPQGKPSLTPAGFRSPLAECGGSRLHCSLSATARSLRGPTVLDFTLPAADFLAVFASA